MEIISKVWKSGCRARRASEAVVNYCERAATTRGARIPSLHTKKAYGDRPPMRSAPVLKEV